MANFKTKLLRVQIRNKTKAKTRLDAKKLKNPEVIKIYQKTISNLLDNNINNLNKNSEEKWKEIKEVVYRIAEIFEKVYKIIRTCGLMNNIKDHCANEMKQKKNMIQNRTPEDPEQYII